MASSAANESAYPRPCFCLTALARVALSWINQNDCEWQLASSGLSSVGVFFTPIAPFNVENFAQVTADIKTGVSLCSASSKTCSTFWRFPAGLRKADQRIRIQHILARPTSLGPITSPALVRVRVLRSNLRMRKPRLGVV
jgi:hypothetical protein